MKKIPLLIAALCILAACNSSLDSRIDAAKNPMSMSVLFNYYATEYKALTIQAYNIAGQKLIEIAKEKDNVSGLAVVLDIDETVLDNSPYQAAAIVEGFEYPEQWNEWCNKVAARAVPGAGTFLSLADSLGYRIFYISNRKHDYVYEGTKLNLRAHGFPQVSDESLLLRQAKSESNIDPSDKELRRQMVRDMGIEIVMLIGDNIGDFYTDTDNSDLRNKQLFSSKESFGNRYIVLPNPMYGNWPASLGLDGTSEELAIRLKEMAMEVDE